jgi:MFS family permease
MLIGGVVCLVVGLLYPVLTTVVGFLLLRFFHGFSTGFTPTGSAAYVADGVPVQQRGQAMGYLGFFNSLGMAAGPALGSAIMQLTHMGYNWLFLTSTALALVSVLALVGLKETLPVQSRKPIWTLRLRKEDLIEPRVLPPVLVLLFTSFSFGVVLTLIPDMATVLGMSNKGTFFSVFTLSSLLSRLTAGRVSDRVGRIPVLLVSTALLTAAMVVVGLAQTRGYFMLGAALYGFALGTNSPALYAWALDLSPADKKGRGMGTVYMALEMAIGLGALVSGYLYQGVGPRLSWAFFMSGGLCALAFAYLLLHLHRQDRPKG